MHIYVAGQYALYADSASLCVVFKLGTIKSKEPCHHVHPISQKTDLQNINSLIIYDKTISFYHRRILYKDNKYTKHSVISLRFYLVTFLNIYI